MEVSFIYSPALAAYDLGPAHPLRPERVLRTVSLLEAYGLLDGPLQRREPRVASREELLRVHDDAYLNTVQRASETGDLWPPERGIGPGDTPAFPGMHEASALVAGATLVAMSDVASGRATRSFSTAGGLHHAHRDRAAGFCVYNDPAVAIADAIARDSSLRVAYLDVDAHHGDGVQEAFYEEPRVLTISLHEDGRYLYPGTGSFRERGEGAGAGYAINVPLPPYATPACYLLAFKQVVEPAVRAFAPDIVFAQCGADAHWSDPLTSLGMTIPGFEQLYANIVSLAENTCEGRLVATGGGGYAWEHVVPRAWALLAAALTGVMLDDALPAPWREIAPSAPASLREDCPPTLGEQVERELLADTRFVIEKLRESDVGAPVGVALE